MILTLSIFAAAGTHLLCVTWWFSRRKSLLLRLRPTESRGWNLESRLRAFAQNFQSKLMSKSRTRAAVSELPDILELMAVSLSAGDGLFGALARVTPRSTGVLAEALRKILSALEIGSDLESELEWLARRLPDRQIVEFSRKLSTALRRGTPLAQMLQGLAESARAELRNDLLRQVGRNETRMLIPLVFLILPVTVLFALYPSLQLLNIDYI